MIKKIIIGFIIICIAIGAWIGYDFYQKIWKKNVFLSKEQDYIYIKTGTTLNQLSDILHENNIIKNKESFLWLCEKKKFTDEKLKPGKYRLKNGWSNNDLINYLRLGNDVKVNITFNNVRTLEQLAGKVAKNIEADSSAIADKLLNEEISKAYGFTNQTFITMFIPNTYQFEWDTDADEFIKRMSEEYKKFWTEERKSKARALGLSQSEVCILASIVQAEQGKHLDEWPIIAGLYINRLRNGIKLQSDPTVKFAVGDFSIRRVLNKHLAVDSPYNTYKYHGLPPGPILLPDVRAVDAVLNYQKNDYLYMCAKPEYSGRHNFSKTLEQHNQYAGQYRQWLDKEGIR
jgi:UPF0755 protein